MKQTGIYNTNPLKEDALKKNNYCIICPNCGHKEWMNPRKCSRCGHIFFLKLVQDRDLSMIQKGEKRPMNGFNYNMLLWGILFLFFVWLAVMYWDVLYGIYQL